MTRRAPAMPLTWEVDVAIVHPWSRGAKAEDDRALRLGAAAELVTIASDEARASRCRDVPRALWRVLRWSFEAAAAAMPKLSDGETPPPGRGDKRWVLEGVEFFSVSGRFEMVDHATPVLDRLEERLAAANYRDRKW